MKLGVIAGKINWTNLLEICRQPKILYLREWLQSMINFSQIDKRNSTRFKGAWEQGEKSFGQGRDGVNNLVRTKRQGDIRKEKVFLPAAHGGVHLLIILW